MELKADTLFDPQMDVLWSYIRVSEMMTDFHSHDFYELFFLCRGSLKHRMNGRLDTLLPGTLVFIRPGDEHAVYKEGDRDGSFVNIAFRKQLYLEVLAFLGADETALPGCGESVLQLQLSEPEVNDYRGKVDRLNLIRNAGLVRAAGRILVLELLSEFLISRREEHGVPGLGWFGQLLIQMRQKENFTSGVSRLYELSSKSPEYIARSFKKYLDTTPTEYLNNLKLEYGAMLLTNSNLPVIEVALESGFENLSHFYHLFRRKFGTSPARYRALHARIPPV